MRFEIGRVLSTTFRVLGKRWPPLLGITAVIMLPLLGIQLWMLPIYDRMQNFQQPPPPDPNDPESMDRFWGELLRLYQDIGMFNGTVTLAQGFFGAIATAAIVHGTFRVMRGEPLDVGACVSAAVGALPRVVAISFVILIGAAVGCVLCCLPFFALWTIWFVAVPAAVVERSGVFASLGRSYALVRPQIWRILALFGMVLAMQMAVGMVAGIVSVAIPVSWVVLVVAWALGNVTTLILAISQCVAYHDLRVAQEGLGQDEIAAVFS